MIDPVSPMALVIVMGSIYCWHLYAVRGKQDLIIFASIVMTIAVVVEFIGVFIDAYRYIWGNYLLNSLFVAFGWITNIYPNMHIAFTITKGKKYVEKNNLSLKDRVVLSALTGVFAVMYDLFLDPLAVQLGIWQWNITTHWFGVPIGNFIGWWLITFVSVFIYTTYSYNHRNLVSLPIAIVVGIIFIILSLGIYSIVLSLV